MTSIKSFIAWVPEVGEHLVHEGDVPSGAGVADLLPPLRDHEVPGPKKT